MLEGVIVAALRGVVDDMSCCLFHGLVSAGVIVIVWPIGVVVWC
jgi:hypothetical protein